MVDAEYGNQGVDFKMVPREGFGWMNCKPFSLSTALIFLHILILALLLAAYQVGLSFLTTHMRRAVATCTSPELFFKRSANNVNAVDQMLDATSNADALSRVMDALNIGATAAAASDRPSA